MLKDGCGISRFVFTCSPTGNVCVSESIKHSHEHTHTHTKYSHVTCTPVTVIAPTQQSLPAYIDFQMIGLQSGRGAPNIWTSDSPDNGSLTSRLPLLQLFRAIPDRVKQFKTDIRGQRPSSRSAITQVYSSWYS